MFRLLQETVTRLTLEENSAMAFRGKDGIVPNSFSGLKEEPSLSETVAELKSQIVMQEKDMFDLRKMNRKLEKRNNNLKESIDKLIAEKRQIEELTTVIEEQKMEIEKYEQEINDFKELQKALEEKALNEKALNEKALNEKRANSPQASRNKTTDPHLLQKQIDLLSAKNLELKAELDRRTRISDQMKREHETALKDRNELLTEVKTLKQQVDDMRVRLDRSLSLLLKKRKGVKDTGGISNNSSNITEKELSVITTKGTQTLREKTSSKIPTFSQNRKAGGGRLILNSVGRSFQNTNTKKTRNLTPQKTEQKNVPEVSPKIKANTVKSQEKKTEDKNSVAVSQSIQEVKGKRVVSDIRNMLEKKNMDQEYVLKIDEYPTPTESQNMTTYSEQSNSLSNTDDIMDLFEVLSEDDSCPRKV